MEIQKLDRDLVFFISGKPGAVFTYSAGYTVNNDLLSQTVENLEYDSAGKVQWVEERRRCPGRPEARIRRLTMPPGCIHFNRWPLGFQQAIRIDIRQDRQFPAGHNLKRGRRIISSPSKGFAV
jgi:hypothetical protein